MGSAQADPLPRKLHLDDPHPGAGGLAVTQGAGSSMFDRRRREFIALLGIVAIVATHHLRVPAGIVAILARTIDKPWAAFCLFLMSWELSNFYQSAQRLIEIIQKAI